jgi:hypothetical protein
MKSSSQPLKEEKDSSPLAWPLTTAMKHRPPVLAGTWKTAAVLLATKTRNQAQVVSQ